MKSFTSQLQSRLKEKKLDQQGLGAVCIQRCKKYSKNPDELSGSIKRGRLRLRLPTQDDRTRRWLQRELIRSELNEYLVELGYEESVKEIKV